MDHLAFKTSLSSSKRAELFATSNAPGLWRLGGHFLLIIILAVPVSLKAPGWPILLFPLGVLLAFLFTLQHECTHNTPFRTQWINECAGKVVGFIIVQPFLWFRYFHLEHHRYTNHPKRDPELLSKPKPETWFEYAAYLSTLVYWKDKILLLLVNAYGKTDTNYIPVHECRRVRTESRIMTFLYSLVIVFSLTVSPLLIWIWIVPLLLGFPFLRLYLLAEHGRCPRVANMFENTRTVFTNNLIRFLSWNMPYHIEHHTLPAVPFHRLPDLHKLIKEHHLNTNNGYAEFTIYYASQLKFNADDNNSENVD